MVRCCPGTTPRRDGRRRLTRGLMLVGLLAMAGLLSACGVTDDPQSTIRQAGEHNARIWSVYNWLWIGAAIVFVLLSLIHI